MHHWILYTVQAHPGLYGIWNMFRISVWDDKAWILDLPHDGHAGANGSAGVILNMEHMDGMISKNICES